MTFEQMKEMVYGIMFCIVAFIIGIFIIIMVMTAMLDRTPSRPREITVSVPEGDRIVEKKIVR